MSNQIITQPDGKYLVLSTITDRIIVRDCTEEELVQYYLKIEEQKLRDGISRIIGKLEKGEKPYYQFTRTYEEAIELDSREVRD